MSNLQVINDDILATRDQFDAVLCDKSINFDREASFAIQILQGNDYALGVAMKNRQSVVNAVTNVAAIGLSLNPALKLAYLVPRKTGIVLEIGYIGLVKLATDSGSVRWVKAELVHEQDSFIVNGFGQPPSHSFNPFSKDRGAVVGVYCVAKTSDGDYLTDAMGIEDVYAIRDRSEAWKNGQKGPWKTDPGEMTKKTIVKRSAKMWPKTERLDQAIHYLNTDGGEGLTDTTPTGFDLDAALALVHQCASREQLDAIFAEHGAFAAKAKDRAGWKELKQACSDRLTSLSQPKELTHV
jgi:recombination protein RecT